MWTYGAGREEESGLVEEVEEWNLEVEKNTVDLGKRWSGIWTSGGGEEYCGLGEQVEWNLNFRGKRKIMWTWVRSGVESGLEDMGKKWSGIWT